MKTIKTFSVVLVFALFCFTECSSKSDDLLLLKSDIIGNYQGTFFTCGKEDCQTVDANFKITKSDSKTFLEFDTIKEEIEIDYSSKLILSAIPKWNASGTSATFGLSGSFEEDIVKIVFSDVFLKADVYQNELVGIRLK